MTRVFFWRPDPMSLRRHVIEGDHQWGVPALACDVCGSTWATFGESYPSLNDPPLRELLYPSKTARALSRAQFNQLRSELLAQLPPDVPLYPGANLGPFAGKARGKIDDFAWKFSNRLFIVRQSAEALLTAGVRLPACFEVSIEFKGKSASTELLEPEALPTVELVLEHSGVVGEQCPACGRPRGPAREIQRAFLGEGSAIPATVDLFRARNWPGQYLVTERFAEAVHSLEMIGGELEEVVRCG